MRRRTMRLLLGCLLGAGACGDEGETLVQTTGRNDPKPSRPRAAPDASAAPATIPVCEIGAVSCEGPLLRRCNDLGSAWEGVEQCRAASLCDAIAGQCLQAR